MIKVLFQTVFFGFAAWSIILPLIILFLKNKRTNLIKGIDNTAVRIIRFAGILFICEILISILSLTDERSQVLINRMFGQYWYGYWTFYFAYFFLTQLLWFKKIGANAFLRIIIAIVILFALYIEKFIILMASLQTPNIEGIAIDSSIQGILIDCLFKLIFFLILVLLVHFVIHWRKKNKNSNFIEH